VPAYPQLVVVPGYPVYYAPRVDGNLFFYDGMYWSLVGDRWYAGTWYNGPWNIVAPEAVPLFLLRVPVRYYRRPPPYVRGWIGDAPPRWGEYWGPNWVRSHRGWDHWDPRGIPVPASLLEYQRAFAGDRYPRGEQQEALRRQSYHYEPRDPAVREHFAPPSGRGPMAPDRPAPNGRAEEQRHGYEPGSERGRDRDHEH
jgi:hypothetical protein